MSGLDLDALEDMMRRRVQSGWMAGDARIALQLFNHIRELEAIVERVDALAEVIEKQVRHGYATRVDGLAQDLREALAGRA